MLARVPAALLALACALYPSAPGGADEAPGPTHDIVSGPGTPLYDGWPPDRYIVETRFQIVLAPVDRVQKLCGAGGTMPLPKGWEFEGCYRSGEIIVFLPSKGDGEHFARIVAHELGHREGWGIDHPL